MLVKSEACGAWSAVWNMSVTRDHRFHLLTNRHRQTQTLTPLQDKLEHTNSSMCAVNSLCAGAANVFGFFETQQISRGAAAGADLRALTAEINNGTPT